MAHNSLKEYTEQAIEAADLGEPLPPLVFLPPRMRGRKTRVQYDVAATKKLPDIRENIVRIQAEVDPMGLLIAIANGQPITELHIDDEGKPYFKIVHPDMKTRFQAIKALADRVHPRMSVTRTISDPDTPDKSRAAALLAGAERDADGQ